jgi:glucose/arabinose dehydrogenase
MRRALLLASAVLAVLAAPASAAPTLPAGFQDSFVASVERPTGLAFTPDGRLLIATAAGQVYVHDDGALQSPAALDISARVCSDSERGMMAVAVDPQFGSNGYVYVYYTYKKFGTCPVAPSTQLPVNRVSRFVMGSNGVVDPNSETVLIDNIPAPQSYHIGADLHFGKDGYLYVSTGDGGCDYADPNYCDDDNDAARDQNVLLGKVLRIDRNGGIPPDNPYRGSDSGRCNAAGRTTAAKCQETFAWGLRNPFRMAFDPNAAGTRFFINDVGGVMWEEIDLGQAGADYGWNVREGHCATGTSDDCGPPPAGMTNPIFDYYHYDQDCWSITGGAFVPNGLWPVEYDGSYLYGDLVCGRMFKLTPNAGGGWAATEFASGFGQYSIVSMTFGPSGSTQALYYITLNAPGAQVRRITNTGPARGYPRPQAASQLRVPLVIAYSQCSAATANRRHSGGLSGASCSPSSTSSSYLTAGTTDANGFAPQSTGNVRLSVCTNGTTASGPCSVPGAMTTPDVRISTSLRDVRCAGSGQSACEGGRFSDYAGELRTALKLRITDKSNGPAGGPYTEPATAQDLTLAIGVPCAPNPSGGSATAIGATCALDTRASSVAPGAVTGGKRANWELGQVEVFDGGPDGRASTADNLPFARSGIFVP